MARVGRGFATAALILLLTSLWLPWYLVRNVGPSGEVYEQLTAALFRPGAIAEPVPVHLSGALIVAATVLLFVRVAGQSWKHEPRLWVRDLRNAAALAAAALALAFAWPEAFPSFWGTLHYDTDAGDATVRTLPGLGWWCALAAAIAALVAGMLRPPASNDK